MTDQTTRRFARPLVAIAAVLGLLAGAAAVYVRESRSGNGAGGETAAADCADAAATVGRITPFLKGQVAAMAPQTPRALPPLSFTDGDGKPSSLAALSGKTLLVNLWATWCVPCREEMPALDALERAMGDARFQVVAVNIDMGSDEKPKAFLDEIGVKALALHRDGSMGVFNTLKKEGLAFGLPATFLVDPKGCLIGAMNGPAAWDSEDAKALIGAAKGA
ncbi:sodium:dicarboxylate symporter [Rhizobium rhizosphaerae]|uniref:Sodium:dicarboxylate symporter n=1 Tax=Xaviernesmea rhizosphaerae TaxID=1672749 RepID=A0A1Q9AFE2_9HYPH|nr:TlpA disulfide reductase family protein [Xaviernesmea rhizosphaerae]OLP53705.1 sodium:dicarboxylate symporter [Xaviernesmea rhizosphaerae]